MTTAIRARDIHAGYPGVPVLHGVSIEVAAGEMLAIVGPNGAGKSTLLKVLGGSLKPEAGSVDLFGRALDSIERREFARTVASVGQENAVGSSSSAIFGSCASARARNTRLRSPPDSSWTWRRAR